MKTYVNTTAEPVDVTYIIATPHFEVGHTCDGGCETKTTTVSPGGLFTFDDTQPNGGLIEDLMATLDLERVD